MKPLEEVVACVWDYGTFVSLAETLAKTYAKVYYYSPFESEYRCLSTCVIGDGLDKVVRLDEPLHPDVLDEISLHVFPDIGFNGAQAHLRSLGKAVWGSNGASDWELYRTRFLKMLEDLGLPVAPYKVVRGVSELSAHLKTVENKHVKINRYRENMETWHHQTYATSQGELDRLSGEFGGLKERPVFIVQDNIESDIEVGYDGWTVDGEFPEESFQGYEKKNELYIGSLTKYEKLPEAVRFINEAFSPILKQSGYRNFWATEIRIKDATPYFIDPTARMPGQTGEQLLETCGNLAQVIWEGANGVLVKPEFTAKYAAEATLHYKGNGANSDGWRVANIPKPVERWVKLYRYCRANGLNHFPPARNDEIGVVLGTGDTIMDAIGHLKENFDELKDEPLKIDFSGFTDLLKQVHEAEEQGVAFSDEPLPDPIEPMHLCH